jgi:hypothetical protein
MTPVLIGRWQTRLLLLGTAGVLITLLFGYLYDDYRTVFSFLGYVALFGLVWDVIYNYIQGYRWDQDWPPAFQLAAGIVEGLFLWAMVVLVGLPGANPYPPFSQFLAHYATVWIVTFLLSQSFLRIIFPRWRYDGGRWL